VFRPSAFRFWHLLVCIRTPPPSLSFAMVMGMVVSVVVVVIMIVSASSFRRSRSAIISAIAITVAIRRALITRFIDTPWGVIDTADCSIVISMNTSIQQDPEEGLQQLQVGIKLYLYSSSSPFPHYQPHPQPIVSSDARCPLHYPVFPLSGRLVDVTPLVAP
jgi:hypothetical protein